MSRPAWPLVRMSLDRPVAVFMILLAILALGLVTYLRMPVQLLPSEGFRGQSITIWVPYPNASPRECEEGIVKPVEEALGAVPGVREIRARAGSDGASVRATFHARADLSLAQADLKEQLDRVKPRFPEGVDRYFLFKFDMNQALPVLFAGVLIDEESGPIHHLIQDVVVPRLQRIEGVARVQVWGLMPRQVQVEVDREAVAGLGLPLYGLIDRLRRENRSVSCGDIVDGGRRYLVRALGKLESLAEIESLPLRAGVHLDDVASVGIASERRESITRVNLKEAIVLLASKESSANTVDVCRNLRGEIETLGADPRLRGLTFHTYFDQGKFITESIGSLKKTALYGGILAVVVLLAFLKQAATTFIVAMAIPLSMLLALIVIYFSGGTLNILSMMGLTLGIGMLVDNSIVVAENVDRLRRQGRSLWRAALEGPSEVGLAIVMSTLTTVVVFLPILFLGDDTNTRVLMKEIGLPVIDSLGASLFVALVFVPAAMLLAGRRRPMPAADEGGGLRRPWLQERIVPLYARLLPGILHHRLRAILYLVLPFLATTGIAFRWVHKTAELGGRSNQLRIEMDFQDGVGLAEADRIVRDFEARLDARRDDLGIEFVAVQFDRTGGSIDLFLDAAADPDRDALEGRLREILPDRAGVELRFGADREAEGEQKSQTMRIALSGPDSTTLAGLAREVESRLRRVPGLEKVRSDLEEGTNEIRVAVDRSAARRQGLDPTRILGLVAYSLRGARLPDFEWGSESLEVWVRFREEDRADLRRLESLRIPVPGGESVPLASLASFRRGTGYRTIVRENRRTTLAVTASFAGDDQESVALEARRALGGVTLPRGYRWEEGGGYREFEEMLADAVKALALGVLFMLLLMGILFESFVLPLPVLLSIPFAVFGGLWSLVVTRTPLDGVAIVGFILLAGVVVNNAIVLIDTINRLRRRGLERAEAIVLAGRLRFRPIWMTSLTTILSLLPMALRERASSEGISYLTMARAVIGGLLVSTLFTLFIVPLFYTLFEDLGDRLRSLLIAAIGARPRHAPPQGTSSQGTSSLGTSPLGTSPSV